MNQENTKYLFETYDDLFDGRHLGPMVNLMCFGFECGDGWFAIIDCLCGQIRSYQENLKRKGKTLEVKAVQVKEKYGGLRFYVGCADDTIDAFISLAERLSYNTCEHCGTTANVTTNSTGWISTLCEACRERA